jgi:hypothetical protein
LGAQKKKDADERSYGADTEHTIEEFEGEGEPSVAPPAPRAEAEAAGDQRTTTVLQDDVAQSPRQVQQPPGAFHECCQIESWIMPPMLFCVSSFGWKLCSTSRWRLEKARVCEAGERG